MQAASCATTRTRTSSVAGYNIGPAYLAQLEVAFDRADVDRSGSLNVKELQTMWQYMFTNLGTKDVSRITDDIHQDVDPNRDGQVSWPELEKFFTGTAAVPNEIDQLIQSSVLQRPPTRKEIAWAAVEFDSPVFSHGAPFLLPVFRIVICAVTNVAIIASILNFIVETVPSVHQPGSGDGKGDGYIVEATCIAIFTAEFIARVSSCPSQSEYWKAGFTWIDLLAIIPFYIGLGMGSNPSGGLLVLRVLRLLRLIRMLKLGRSLEIVQVLIIAISRVLTSLMVAVLMVNGIAVILFASLMYTVELDDAEFDKAKGEWVRSATSSYPDAGKPVFFQSIPHSMWWAWVTLTTVGYGDMYPMTGPGKTVAACTMVCGLVLMAFPLTLLANSFANTLSELQTKKNAQQRGRVFLEQLQMHCPELHDAATRYAIIAQAAQALCASLSGHSAPDEDVVCHALGKVQTDSEWVRCQRLFGSRFGDERSGGDLRAALASALSAKQLSKARDVLRMNGVEWDASDVICATAPGTSPHPAAGDASLRGSADHLRDFVWPEQPGGAADPRQHPGGAAALLTCGTEDGVLNPLACPGARPPAAPPPAGAPPGAASPELQQVADDVGRLSRACAAHAERTEAALQQLSSDVAALARAQAAQFAQLAAALQNVAAAGGGRAAAGRRPPHVQHSVLAAPHQHHPPCSPPPRPQSPPPPPRSSHHDP